MSLMPLTLKKKKKNLSNDVYVGLTSFYLCWTLECQDRDECRRQESSSEEIVLIWLKVTFRGWRDASAGKTLEDQNSDPQNHGKVKWASGSAVISMWEVKMVPWSELPISPG